MFASKMQLLRRVFRLAVSVKKEIALIKAISKIGNRQRPTLPGRFQPSTIGAERLNCCVRNENRCIPLAIVTGIVEYLLYTHNYITFLSIFNVFYLKGLDLTYLFVIKPSTY